MICGQPVSLELVKTLYGLDYWMSDRICKTVAFMWILGGKIEYYCTYNIMIIMYHNVIMNIYVSIKRFNMGNVTKQT